MANPTTNYGFVLPTSSDLVTDLPADFDVALQGVDTRLKALQPGTTLGDLAYSSATANTNTRLAIGSTGNVLTVAGGVPTWAAPAGGGKVLQVKNFVYSTAVTSNTSTLITSGLTLDITPTSATSKILVLVSCQGGKYDQNTFADLQLRRGATTLANFGGVGGYTNSTAYQSWANSLSYLDSPATTSATTYVVYFASGANLANCVFNWTAGVGDANSSITLLEIGA
jgi:hypothetical protein